MSMTAGGPSYLDEFRDIRPRLERLYEEVLFTLNQALEQQEIKTHTVTGRVKDEKSFAEKIGRKDYDNPLHQMEDLVGCRVVCLFLSDLPRIEKLIEESFTILTQEDKVVGESADTFGYMSVHYTCELHSEVQGPRYSELKDLQFEIQCRTIVMDAWANISHYLAYKGKNSIPQDLRQDFYALSGLFYVADKHFELFYDEARDSKIAAESKMAGERKSPDARTPINLDTMLAYLGEKYPDRKHSDPASVSEFVEEAVEAGYDTIQHLDVDLTRAQSAAEVYEQNSPPTGGGYYLDIGIARQALAIVNTAYRAEKYESDVHGHYEHLLAQD